MSNNKEVLTRDDLKEFYVIEDEIFLEIKKYVNENNSQSNGKLSDTEIYVNRGKAEGKRISFYVRRKITNEFTNKSRWTDKIFIRAVDVRNVVTALKLIVSSFDEVPFIVYSPSIVIRSGVNFDSDRLITFGAYKGVNVDHLKVLDPDYFKWLRRTVTKETVIGGTIGSPDFMRYVYKTYCHQDEDEIAKRDIERVNSFRNKKIERAKEYASKNDLSTEDTKILLNFIDSL